MHIDRLIQRIKSSNLAEDRKAQAIRVLNGIRSILQAVRRFVRDMVATLREHQDALRILAIALLVAILAKAVPIIGDVLAFLVILIGAGTALVAEVRRAFTGLFELEPQTT